MSTVDGRHERADAVAIAALTLLCTTWALPRWADWNQSSRLDLTVAIVDHHTLAIDCCVENTGDYAIFDGHTYSDKAPGLSLLAVPPYAAWQGMGRLLGLDTALERAAHGEAMQDTLRVEGTGLRPDKIAFAAALWLTTLFAVAFPAAIANAVMFLFLARFSGSRRHRIAVTLAYALATIAFPYAGNFYAHQLVAALLFSAFALAQRLPAAQCPHTDLFGIGLLLGVAVISEYPATLIVAVLVAYVVRQLPVRRCAGALTSDCRARAQRSGARARNRRAELDYEYDSDDAKPERHGRSTGSLLAALTAGFLPPLLLGAGYHWAIFHTPLPVAYRYSALWQARHSVGFMSISYPQLDALWGITFSPYRGLFLLCPVLLLSMPGMRTLWRNGWRAEVAASAAAVILFVAFNSASVMWWGGHSIGPRYLVPMLPFLAWPLIGFLDASDAAWRRWLFAMTAAISFTQVWGLTYAGQHFPEESWRFPLREYAWPELRRGNLARNIGMFMRLTGWWSLTALAGAGALLGSAWRITTQR